MNNESISPIELLMKEHQLILRAIASLETFVELYAAASSSARHEDIGAFVRFIRDYSDVHHHGKEENILFKQMIENGFPSEQGPIAVMLSEHDQGRVLVGRLTEVAKKAEKDVTPADRQLVKESAQSYANLLKQHIQKEDQILYPMALEFLPEKAKAALAEEFVRFESDPKRKTEIADLVATVNELLTV